MQKYFHLLRTKHYIKNVLIFLPMFFGGLIFDKSRLINALLGFITFSSTSSVVYIINDYRDIEKDRKHPKKKNRPLASGAISKKAAILIALLCLCISITNSIILNNYLAAFCVFLYFTINILYSMGLKNKPIVDVVILATGFVIRVIYGGLITSIPISKWLYLVIITGSLYMGLGKRRNELRAHTETREVLKYYNEAFLDKNMYVCVTLVNIFYALWTIELPNPQMIWTFPVFLILLMCYSLNVEGDSDGDPVEVITHDKYLLGIVMAYAICIFLLLYIFK